MKEQEKAEQCAAKGLAVKNVKVSAAAAAAAAAAKQPHSLSRRAPPRPATHRCCWEEATSGLSSFHRQSRASWVRSWRRWFMRMMAISVAKQMDITASSTASMIKPPQLKLALAAQQLKSAPFQWIVLVPQGNSASAAAP